MLSRNHCTRMTRTSLVQHGTPSDNSTSVGDGIDSELMEIMATRKEHPLSNTLILVLSTALLVTLSLLIVMTVICCRLRSKQRRRSSYQAAVSGSSSSGPGSLGLTDLAIDLSKLPSNMAYHLTDTKLNPKLEALEYPRNDIIYIRDIGQGAFGRVFQVSGCSCRRLHRRRRS